MLIVPIVCLCFPTTVSLWNELQTHGRNSRQSFNKNGTDLCTEPIWQWLSRSGAHSPLGPRMTSTSRTVLVEGRRCCLVWYSQLPPRSLAWVCRPPESPVAVPKTGGVLTQALAGQARNAMYLVYWVLNRLHTGHRGLHPRWWEPNT